MSAAPKVPTTVGEVNKKYMPMIDRIGQDFAAVLASGKPSSIADRVRRSSATLNCINECSADLARVAEKGDNGSFDVAVILLNKMTTTCKQYFDNQPPKGTISGGAAFPDIEAIQTAAADLRRVVAEAGVTFQNLQAQPHLTLDGGSVREHVVRVAASNGKWAKLPAALAQIVLDTFRLHRKSPAYSSWQDHRLLALIREAVNMIWSLTLPDERTASLQKLVIDPFLWQVRNSFGSGKLSVKEVLEIAKTTMKSELVMAEFALKEHYPTITDVVKAELQKVLLSNNAKRIAEDREYGAMAALRKPLIHADEFAALVTLLDFDEASIQCIDEAVMVAVAEAVLCLLEKGKYQDNFVAVVHPLIRLAADYRLTVSPKHTSHTLRHRFCVSVQAGVMSGLPDDASFEEAFVNVIDGILKEKRGSPDTRGERLLELLDGVTLIRDPRLFAAFYKRLLAARLLLRPYVSLTLEATTLDGIESRLGATPVRHLRAMLAEVSASAPPNAVWCSEYVWPSSAVELRSMRLPPSIADRVSAAVATQSALPINSRKTFTVDPTLTSVEILYRPRGAQGHACRLLCCAAQAAVLMAVAAAGAQGATTDEIGVQLNCPGASIAFVVKSLSGGGLVRLNEVSGRCIAVDSFMDGAEGDRKLALPTLTAVKRREMHQDPMAAVPETEPPTSDDSSSSGWLARVARVRELLKFRR